MNTNSFDDFIEQQTKSAQTTPIDWEKRLEEWKNYLDTFYSSVEEYLKPYIDAEKLSIDKTQIHLQEEYVGEYETQQLTIHLGSNTIRLKPVGTNLIAAKGRVDMLGPKGEVKFVLVNKDFSGPEINVRIWIKEEEQPPKEKVKPVTGWAWKIATPPPHISYIELEQESFQSALMEVVNG
ncbi:hypothetical protein [Candidatus Venteria ishoeyi]|uniref:Uncharacterized protein n=1 Tax=Candidatus Venteria ishoeyi TaxID=1899563 RepID=A0A1H6F402_9GAMM|nr:hypothetical protein [Candidatus Venteria ishoeyi]SEH04812.1 Uncharacterised protein [Candidatus Venteria ishoeyi]